MRLAALFLFATVALLAQTFSSTTQLVVETVAVRDKGGKPVEGLKANDFTVTEDGVPQKISFFEQQHFADAAPVPRKEEHLHIYDKLSRSHISPETLGSEKYKNRRLLALYFDMSAMPPGDQTRALSAAEKFIRTQMTGSDVMAILRYNGGSVDVLQDFTDNVDRLLSILQTMVVGEDQGMDESNADASAADTGAAFGQDDSEFNIFNTDRQLSALQTAATMLGQLNEKKSLIYFASGLHLNGLNNQAQLHATINAAVRAGVSFWPIDARGLVASPPIGDASQGSPGNSGIYSGTAALAVATNFQQSQDSLYALAADTGGKAFLDSNDLVKGISEVEQSLTTYYVIGYYTTNAAQDGKFRRIKVSLNGELAANLDYRQGYFASKQFSKFTATDKERQLEEALMLPDPITELTVAMEIDYFQMNRAEYFVPIVVKIPGRELALAKRGGAEHTLIDFVGEIKDDYGATVTNLRDKVDVKVSDATAQELAKRPIEYDAGFTLLPGKYSIKVLARDAETGRIGTYQTSFRVPNLNKELQRLAISSVVLSSQRVELKDALYNAVKNKDRSESANPLVRDGKKLIPSVTRVFSSSRDLYVYLQAYQPETATQAQVIAFVSFYADNKKVWETKPVQVTGDASSRLKTASIDMGVELSQLAPGKYDCQVTVLQPTAKKAAFWQAPIMVVQ